MNPHSVMILLILQKIKKHTNQDVIEPSQLNVFRDKNMCGTYPSLIPVRSMFQPRRGNSATSYEGHHLILLYRKDQ